MIKFKQKLYGISDKIIYKQKTINDDCINVEYIVYVNKQPYIIKGISADIFLALISSYEYCIEECILNMEGSYDNKIETVYNAMASLIKKEWAIPLEVDTQIKCLKSIASIPLNVENKYFLLNSAYRTIDEVSEIVYKSFKADDYSLLDVKEINYLIGRKYINYNHDKEMNQLIINQDFVNIYVIFSYECNMKCIYCFENTETRFHKENKLTMENLLGIIEKISSKKNAIITLYGGEPLLDTNKDKINKIIDWGKEKDNISFRIITNGTNVKSFMPQFLTIKNKILEFVITIDGPEVVHDKRRFFADGQGSFDKIIQTIKLLCDNSINVSIRVNLDKHNIDHQYDFLKYLSNQNINRDFMTLLYYRVENKSDISFDTLSYKQCYKLYKDLSNIKDIKINFGDPILSLVTNMTSSDNPYPYIKSNYCNMDKTYVIDCDGKIYCCNESMGLSDFSRCLNTQKITTVCSLTEKCKKCNLYYGCYGGCNLKRYNYEVNCGKEMCEKGEILDIIKELCNSYSNKQILFSKNID